MEKMLATYLLLCLALGSATGTVYTDCGSEDEIISFELDNCDIPPCEVYRPSTQHVNITFVSASDAEKIDTKIIATIAGEDFPFPGPGGCGLLLEGKECPIGKDVEYSYSAKMPVLSEYPAVNPLVTWMLIDEHDKVHFCGVVPIRIH